MGSGQVGLAPGHSPGHTSYVISSAAGRLIVFGDTSTSRPSWRTPDWASKPDVDGMAVLAARQRLIAELEHPDTLGFSYHFGDQAFGRVVRDEEWLPAWEPVPAVSLLPAPRQLAD